MEPYIMLPLPSLFQPSPPHLSDTLPELHPVFFIPKLEDRPQNPIVESRLEGLRFPELVKREEDEVVSIRGDAEPQQEEVDVVVEETEAWAAEEEEVAGAHAPKNQNLSWDALRATFPKKPTPSPFLSDQSSSVFDAVRHSVQPPLNDPSLQRRYILPTELLDYLLINLMGNSSPLYIWDSTVERFVPYGMKEDSKVLVLIQGLDDLASNSIIQRFLNIGSLIRRLELLVNSLQRGKSSSTAHAFSHALSTILVHIRTSLSRPPPHPAIHLTSLWLHYADAESELSALASLCHRAKSPPYDPLSSSPADLLSHIYECLEQHIELRSPRTMIALFAYILTITSKDYFTTLEESLGLSQSSRSPWLLTSPQFKSRDQRRADDTLPLDDGEFDEASVSSAGDDLGQYEIPSFIPPDLAEALPAARKSLRILQAADPSHYLFSDSVMKSCQWVWSSEEVERLWGCRGQSHEEDILKSSPDPNFSADEPAGPVRHYEPDLVQFELFDLEPGAHWNKTTAPSQTPRTTPSLPDFLASFPDSLPSLTPKLQHLATIVLQPLFIRTAALSQALLKLYLTSLQYETQLTLLRSYMLFTLPSFRLRLVEALLSDADEFRPMGRGIRAQTRARLGIQDSRDLTDAVANPAAGQGIGLGHGLAERGTWPPGGADLSFFLRSVIFDSLEERKSAVGDDSVESIWREGEYRLGFALRDLPVGDGMERWLNPMSIEALDFLYLDYKPPYPLDVVITRDILSKYQRTFTFLLRLFRGTSLARELVIDPDSQVTAETVVRIVYRSTFKSTSPVFSYAPKAQDMLLSLRFQIQTFVTAFVTYVFDCVIGGNFDAYLRRISKLRDTVMADDLGGRSEHEIMNVFALRDSHSELLDRILSGCLLRTVQRAAGGALRELLGLILQFGILVANLRRGTIQEAKAAEDLLELYTMFQSQMLLFVKTLQVMHVKEQGHRHSPPGYVHAESSSHQSEESSYLEEILTRIDPMRWWRRKLEKQTKRTV